MSTPARLIDMHAHWATRRGYLLRTPAELAQQERTWRSTPRFLTEEEMTEEFRAANLRVILDLFFERNLPLDEAREYHDYAIETQRLFPDAIIGNWIHVNPLVGKPALDEFERVLGAGAGFTGLAIAGSGGVPADDALWAPFYARCIEANVPVLIFVGTTGLGAGLPGGAGIRLDSCHPRRLDEVAAAYPELTIVAARPAWPWQSEMIAIMLHKPNVWYELHGWSPRYFTDELKREIRGRLGNRVMFGSDYPLFSYERLIRDWSNEGYSGETLEAVFFKNAERFFAELGS